MDMQDAGFPTMDSIAGLVSHFTSALSALNTTSQDLQTLLPPRVLHMHPCRSSKMQEKRENNKHRLCSLSTFIQPTRVGHWIQLDHRDEPWPNGPMCYGATRLKPPRCAHHHEAGSHFRCLRLDSLVSSKGSWGNFSEGNSEIQRPV